MIVRRVATATLLASVLSLGACGGAGSSVPQDLRAVGRVSGSDAFVAMAKYGRTIDAYVCDGKSVGESFQGQAGGGGHVDLRSDDGARLQTTVAGDEVRGRFTPAGAAPLAFTARAARKPAGLYRAQVVANGQTVTAGWVVLPDGEQRGTQRTGLLVTPAPIVDGTSNVVTLAGMPVKAVPIDENNP